MERETKKLTTPLGKEVEIKTYLTARERNQIRDIYVRHMKVDQGEDGKMRPVDGIPGIAVSEAENKLIEITVISYDDSSEKILDRLLDSTTEEYDFVFQEANKVKTGNLAEAK